MSVARYARGPLLRSQPDARLVHLVQAGSEPAFEALDARYRAPLLRYCRRLLPADRAEDAVQQAFVNAHAAIVAGRGGSQLRPWLYRIAHNVAIDQLRQRRGADEDLPEDLAGGDRPDEAWTQRELLADVLAALDDLPPRQRDALVLRELEGRSYEEIATALGVGNGAVRQLLNRARHTLRSAVAALVPPILRFGTSGTAEVAGGPSGAGAAAKGWTAALVAAASIGGVAALPVDSPTAPGDQRTARPERAEAAPSQPVAPTAQQLQTALAPASVPAQPGAREAKPSVPEPKAPRAPRSWTPAPENEPGDEDRDEPDHRDDPVDEKHDGAEEGDEPRAAEEGQEGSQGDHEDAPETDLENDGGPDEPQPPEHPEDD